MRILMLDNEFPPKGGGMGTVNKALLDRLAARGGMEIDLVTSALDDRYTETGYAAGIRIFYVPVGRGNIHHATNPELFRYTWQAYRLGRRLAAERAYDFAFAWSTVPAGAVAYALERRIGLPFMTWVSGPDIPGFERRYDYIFPLLKPLLRVIWRHSRPLIAKCREEVDLILAAVRDLEVAVVPNGVDTERFRPGARFGDNGPLHVVCAARLIERKGQRQLIAAAELLKKRGVDVRIRLVGDGDAMDSYRKEAAERGVSDRVEFIGFADPERVAGYLSEADAFALPSQFEGMSLATLEAMASGLPVVVTPTGGIGEMVEEGVNGFTFVWGDTHRLAGHLDKLASDRELIRQMGLASREKSLRFNWDRIAAEYVRLFERLAGSAGAAA